jgi:LAO/AO transport system kinase
MSAPAPAPRALAAAVLRGDARALAQAVTLVENHPDRARPLLDAVHSRTGRAFRIGVTGPPGAGKSTLVDGLAGHFRRLRKSVGVLAVDPSSPFTGGALLGDRIRMQRHAADPGVFIRSMAARGAAGGLAPAALDAADLLDAAGRDYVLLETVGVGQAELAVAGAADCVIVVLSPESGDGVQALKAGLLEIADLIVINKADRPGAEPLAADLRAAFEVSSVKRDPPVLLASAAQGDGLMDLLQSVLKFRREQESRGSLDGRRRARLAERIRGLAMARLTEGMTPEAAEALADAVAAGRETLRGAAEKLARMGRNRRP